MQLSKFSLEIIHQIKKNNNYKHICRSFLHLIPTEKRISLIGFVLPLQAVVVLLLVLWLVQAAFVLLPDALTVGMRRYFQTENLLEATLLIAFRSTFKLKNEIFPVK